MAVPDGSVVWTRDGTGCSAGDLTGPWRYDADPAAYEADLVNVRDCDWDDDPLPSTASRPPSPRRTGGAGGTFSGSARRRGLSDLRRSAPEDDRQGDQPQAPADVPGEVGEVRDVHPERDDDAGGDQRRRGVAEPDQPAACAGPAQADHDQHGERRGEGVADGLAERDAQPGVQLLERLLRVGAALGDGGVLAETGDEEHPPGQADDLDGGGGDADPGDPAAEAAAGEPAEQDSRRSEHGRADHEDQEPAAHGVLVLAVERQDDVRGLLEDLRVVEHGAEGGEAGDREQGGRGHRTGSQAAGGRGVHRVVSLLRLRA